MGSPYIGEIRLFAGNFPPAGWAFCNGQLVAISENETLFNLIGTTYGGDGQATFALPDLTGRAPVHQGQGPGISQQYIIGQQGGVEQVTLSTQQIPNHTHPLQASTDPVTVPNPQSNVIGTTATTTPYFNDDPLLALNAQSVTTAGGSQPHENMQPFLCLNFIISLFGIFPTQT